MSADLTIVAVVAFGVGIALGINLGAISQRRIAERWEKADKIDSQMWRECRSDLSRAYYAKSVEFVTPEDWGKP